jgi:hypothetical protein
VDYGVLTVDGDGLTAFTSGITPRMVRGLDSLYQMVVMEFASSSVAGSGGSGFFDAIFNTPPADPDSSRIFEAFRRARANLFSYQGSRSGLSPDETLRELELLELRPVPELATWETDIQITNAENEQVIRTFAGTEEIA